MVSEIPKTISAVPGTMRIHQVITTAKHCISYRDVSCFCCFPSNLVCSCYELKKFEFPPADETVHNGISFQHVETVDASSKVPEQSDNSDIHDSSPASMLVSLSTDQPTASTSNSSTSSAANVIQLDCVNDSHVGQWCAVQYCGKVYPGIIEAVEETDAEVNCMTRIGENRFFWSIVEDKIWYHSDDVLAIIPEPTKVGTRAFQICPSVWKLLQTYTAQNK